MTVDEIVAKGREDCQRWLGHAIADYHKLEFDNPIYQDGAIASWIKQELEDYGAPDLIVEVWKQKTTELTKRYTEQSPRPLSRPIIVKQESLWNVRGVALT
jgi:hypothetical protein